MPSMAVFQQYSDYSYKCRLVDGFFAHKSYHLDHEVAVLPFCALNVDETLNYSVTDHNQIL